MPAKSKNQQQAAGMALAAKRGEIPVSKLKGSAKSMYDSMTKKELKEYAETDRKDLPEKKASLDADIMRGFCSEVSKEAAIGNIAKSIAKMIAGAKIAPRAISATKRFGRQAAEAGKLVRGGYKGMGSRGALQAAKGVAKSPRYRTLRMGTALGGAGLGGYTLGKRSEK